MSMVGNVIWFFCGGGLLGGLTWCFVSLICFATVVGAPFGYAAWRVARFAFCPFGKEAIDARLLGEKQIKGTTLGNVLWVLFAGLWLFIAHVVAGIACCLTIIGIPFGVGHFRIAVAAFAPLGKRIVSKDLANAARARAASVALDAKICR